MPEKLCLCVCVGGGGKYHRCLFVLDVQGTALTPKLLYCVLLAFIEGKMNKKIPQEKNKNGNVYFISFGTERRLNIKNTSQVVNHIGGKNEPL